MVGMNNLKPKYGSVHKRKRLGTGQGSGHGQTSTRGQKGQGSTSGGTKPKGFEGGQTPLLRRIPKSGFSNAQFRQIYEWVNISSLEKNFSAGADVTPDAMVKCRLVKHPVLVKVLGNGELTKALNVTAHSFSKGAAEKIMKAGGKTTVLVGAKAAKTAEVAAQAVAKKKAKTDKK
ncbi:MAG: 50S ribosomal protein L15 [Elusimicrobia bacterium GWA2_61_42]|nr:MAG: 50S ribosomal protein L15 [Elusimicrobia bacterium GWA2_61_42]OGR76880.1 MAG: 50S ribosomal protein L15 [Elusimicrobia bacterium GWC2_61_25]